LHEHNYYQKRDLHLDCAGVALVAMADRAMYVAKKSGKDRIVVFRDIEAVEAHY